jgi:hypothetical protein
MNNLESLAYTDLGPNIYPLFDCVSQFNNSTFVDLGVREGVSSGIMLMNSDVNNNKVFGVDVDKSPLNSYVLNHPQYNFILGDSATIGKQWTGGDINILFVDTFHIKEQVMIELYYWYPYVAKNGYIVFHDSNWPEGKQDIYGGIGWPRVEEGIKDFFNINEMNYSDDFIDVKTYPESWGMTFVKIKEKKDYISLYNNWEHIFERRNHLINLFWNEENKNDVNIELKLEL